MLGVTPARIGSAAAVLRRVVKGSTRRGADRALAEENFTLLDLGHHLGPEEPRQFPGDGGSDDRAHILVRGQLSESAAQADLGRPRACHRSGGTSAWRSLMPTPTLGRC